MSTGGKPPLATREMLISLAAESMFAAPPCRSSPSALSRWISAGVRTRRTVPKVPRGCEAGRLRVVVLRPSVRALREAFVRCHHEERRSARGCEQQPGVVAARGVRHAHEELRHLMPAGGACRV